MLKIFSLWLMLILVPAMVFSSVCISEYGIFDYGLGGESDGVISPGEQASILFEIDSALAVQLVDMDSIVTHPSRLYQISEPVIDGERRRGNFNVNIAYDNISDTSIIISLQIFINQKIDTLEFPITIAYKIDSIYYQQNDSVISIRAYHKISLNNHIRRFLKITHFPSQKETLIDLEIFDPQTLVTQFTPPHPGLYIVKNVFQIQGNFVELDNPVYQFFQKPVHPPDYLLITDFNPETSEYCDLQFLSKILNDQDLIYPLELINSSDFNFLKADMVILYFANKFVFDFNSWFAELIEEYSQQNLTVILGSSTFRAMINNQLTRNLLIEHGFNYSGEVGNINGNLNSKISPLQHRSVNLDDVLNFSGKDTLISISGYPVMIKSTNLIMVAAGLRSLSLLNCPLFSELTSYIQNGYLNEDEQVLIEPLIIEKVFPNPVFQGGASVSLAVTEMGNVKLAVTDISGREVYPLYNGDLTPGNYNFYWNGEDRYSQNLPGGLYFISAVHSNLDVYYKTTYKIILVR
ncbi:MAG: FlgD immunoglobulin-like domain containing protein [bacterium]